MLYMYRVSIKIWKSIHYMALEPFYFFFTHNLPTWGYFEAVSPAKRLNGKVHIQNQSLDIAF